MVLDADADRRLWADIDTIVGNTDTLAMMSENISAMALRHSDEKIVEQAEKIIRR